MTKEQATRRLIQMQRLGEAKGLVVHGWLRGEHMRFIHDFAGGQLTIENAPLEGPDVKPDYRIWFASRNDDGRCDVSDFNDEEFVEFMKAQPAELVEIA